MNTYECTVNPEFERQSLLKFFLRDGIEIYHSDRLNVTEIEFCNGNAKEIMAWDELLGYFYNEVEQYYLKNYDYCFLKNALIEAKECETIVVGSSYARFGIEEKILSKKAKNLSLPSQDIYYAAKISRHISNTNLSLKDVFIGCSYYYFYSDVSRSRSDSERKQVSDVYYPIFGDAHNALVLKSREEFSKSNVFDVGKIMETIERDIYSTVGGGIFYNVSQKVLYENRSSARKLLERHYSG